MLGVLLNTVFAAENKQLTVKGFYNLPSVINMDTKNTAFAGSNVEFSSNADVSIGGGLGIGIEAVIAKVKENIEIIGGGSWSFQRTGSDFEGKWKAELGNQKETSKLPLGSDVNDIKVNIKSIYAKARYLFNPETSTSFYVAGKAAYNMIMIDFSSPYIDDAKFDSGIGFGFSVGMIYENDFDIEIAIDSIMGAAKHNFNISDGYVSVSDTLKGNYSLTNMSVSVGYRF
jgi:hypothetical protein